MAPRLSRRTVIRGIGAASAIGLAGCSGGDSGDGGTQDGGTQDGGSGDGGSDPTQTATPTTTTSAAGGGGLDTWRYGVGTQGGASLPSIQAVAAVFKENSDRLRVSPQTTQGHVHSLRLLSQGNLESTLHHSFIVNWAYTETGPFADTPLDTLPVGAWPTIAKISHHFLLDGSRYEYVNELQEGDVVAIGDPGGSIPIISEAILRSAGVWETVTKRRYTWSEAQRAFRSGDVDAMVSAIVSLQTNPASQQVWELMDDVEIGKLTSDELDALTTEHPFLSQTTVDTNHPKFAESIATGYEEITMPLVSVFGTIHPDVDPDLPYHMIRTLHENQGALDDYFSNLWGMGFGSLTIDGQEYDRWGLEGYMSSVPVHPGVAEYLKEIGEWNSDWTVADI